MAGKKKRDLTRVYAAMSLPIPIAPYWDDRKFDECLEVPLNEFRTTQEWDELFKALLVGIAQSDAWIRRALFRRVPDAVKAEAEQAAAGSRNNVAKKRMQQVLSAIISYLPSSPHLFEEFCEGFSTDHERRLFGPLLLRWLDELSAKVPQLAPASILAAQVLFGHFGYVWQQAGPILLELLDHENLTVRACAAGKIGEFYSRAHEIASARRWGRKHRAEVEWQTAIEGLPSREHMLAVIKEKEIQRPGVAGAFWYACPVHHQHVEWIDDTEADEWILENLEKSPAPEPYLPYFPCNLAFDAHERFSSSPTAIRRLMNAGREDIAVAAATEEDRRVDGIEPILWDLGLSADEQTVRLASWHLAYQYGVLHPKGKSMGFVELVSVLPEVDLFLLGRKDAENKSPYAVVIYDKARWPLTKSKAEKWVEKIFPAEARGRKRAADRWSNQQRFQRGFISYEAFVSKESDAWDYYDDNPQAIPEQLWNVHIGYRSDKPWNPLDYLD